MLSSAPHPRPLFTQTAQEGVRLGLSAATLRQEASPLGVALSGIPVSPPPLPMLRAAGRSHVWLSSVWSGSGLNRDMLQRTTHT